MIEHFPDLQDELADVGDHKHLGSGNRLVYVRQRAQRKTHGLPTSVLRLRNEVAARSRMNRMAGAYWLRMYGMACAWIRDGRLNPISVYLFIIKNGEKRQGFHETRIETHRLERRGCQKTVLCRHQQPGVLAH